jgi:hypothetical protein
MADFVAVIRKAVDSLPNNTPENRAKVYDKARAAIRRQLEAINPPPSDEVIARQLDKLGAAIDEVESEHAEALPADVDETEALMAELESMVEKSPVIAEPKPEPRPEPKPAPKPEPRPAVTAPVVPASVAPAPAAPVRQDPPRNSEPAPLDYDDYDDAPAPYEPARKAFVEPEPAWDPEPVSRPADLVGEAHDAAFGLDHARERQTARPVRQQPAQRSGKGGLLAAALVALFVVVVAVAGWFYKDTVVAMFGGSTGDAPVGSDVASGDAPPAADTADTAPETAETAPETAPVETALTEEAVVPGEDGKFTQRLNPDGTETDAGPAEGVGADGALEGRSVAALNDAGPADESVAEEATADAAVAPGEAAAPDSQPLGVQQKMILYEERLGQQSLEVKPGTVVWTLVSEQTGDGPDEQVIRGEINNPEKGLSALLTIKRNTDASLPASHIVEIVFALPADFDGGSIDQLQRIAMKQTEADQGTPLIAVPAKITQDFYMVALNDLEEARRENTELMRNRSWIDIPVVYSNGRQALITLEKGASGTEVFNQALDAWARAGG